MSTAFSRGVRRYQATCPAANWARPCFDHIGGAGAIADGLNPLPLVALHPADHRLWQAEGGAPLFDDRTENRQFTAAIDMILLF